MFDHSEIGKMKKNNQRMAFRLPFKLKQQIDELIDSGKFKNQSEVIRKALEEFLQKGDRSYD